MSTVPLDTFAVFLILLSSATAAFFAVWTIIFVWETSNLKKFNTNFHLSKVNHESSLEACLGAPGAAEVVGVILAGEALSAEGKSVVANLNIIHFRYFIIVHLFCVYPWAALV